MTAITRRAVLASAGATVAVTGMLGAVRVADPKEEQFQALFRQMPVKARAPIGRLMRLVTGLPDNPDREAWS